MRRENLIDWYTDVNQLNYYISMGLRMSEPTALEEAIVVARQEKARHSFNHGIASSIYITI